MAFRDAVREMVQCDTDGCWLPAQERVVLHSTGTVYRKCCHHAWAVFVARSGSGFCATRQTLEGGFVLQWPGVVTQGYRSHRVARAIL